MAMELTGRLQDGFPGDRRIRPANYVQLDIKATTRNFINIWLPEGLRDADGKGNLFLPGQVRSFHWDTTPTDGVQVSGEVDGVMRFTGTVDEFQFGAAIALTIENVSGKPLRGIHAGVCVQLAAAPDFADFGRQRTFWRRDGRWEGFPDTEEKEGGLCVFYKPSHVPDLPLIAVESSTGPHALGLIGESATTVGGNCHRSIGCIHSHPAAVDLAPGASSTRQMRLFLHPDGKDAVLQLAEAFWSEVEQRE